MTPAASPRFIALEWNAPELYGVLGELEKKYGWRLLYCVGYNVKEKIAADCPHAIRQDTYEARYGRPAQGLEDLPLAPMDQADAETLGYNAVMCLKQMDRMELLGGFNLHDRLIHLHRLFSYWSATLDKLKPDAVIMPTSPHVTYDFIAYLLAKRRGIPVIMFEYVSLAGTLAAIDGFEDGIPQLIRAHEKLRATPLTGPIALSERMEQHLRALKGKYETAVTLGLQQMLQTAEDFKVRESDWAERQRLAEADARTVRTRLRRFRTETRAAIRLRPSPRVNFAAVLQAARKMIMQNPPSEFKPRPPLPADGYYKSAFHSPASEEIAKEAAEFRRQHIESLSIHYDRLAVQPDLKRPYVYVALHLQPERATNPNGRVYDEQHAIVALISASLPQGWHIYVKEHPSHMVPHYATERGRWTTLYDRIAQLPNASLVARNTPSFALIDNARAVATVTGTSSWEALVRGVPTMMFGEAWYKGCEGVYAIRTLKDCRLALAEIASGKRPSETGIRLFLKAAEEIAFVGYISSDDAATAGIDSVTNTARLTAAIDSCYREACSG